MLSNSFSIFTASIIIAGMMTVWDDSASDCKNTTFFGDNEENCCCNNLPPQKIEIAASS